MMLIDVEGLDEVPDLNAINLPGPSESRHAQALMLT